MRLIHSIETLLLDGGVENYEYLNKSRREVDGIDDKEEWSLLKVCVSSMIVYASRLIFWRLRTP